jgi:methionyl-tRNA formyltransferase
MDSKLKVVFFGTPSFVVPVLDNLYQNFTVVGIVTAPDTIQGRKKILTPSPVSSFGKTNNIPVLTPQQFSEDIVTELKNLAADVFIVAAYGKIIPLEVIDLPKYGSLNIHPSLLPLYRGPSPIQTALLNGDDITGVTIIKMDEKMDHGAILSQWKVELKPDDTFAKLHISLFEDAANRLTGIIKEYIDGSITLTPQDDTKATTCHMITRTSGYFDSNNPPTPIELDRMIRAYFPWPNAWTRLTFANNKEQIVKFYPENKVQIEGGKPMNLEELFNGHPEIKEKISGLLGKN